MSLRQQGRRATGQHAAYQREYRARRRDGIRCPCGANLMILCAIRPSSARQPALYCSPGCRDYYTYQTCVSLIGEGWRIEGGAR